MHTLEQLNRASDDDVAAALDGVYEHSPWVARAAAAMRPFRSLAHLKYTLARAVREAGREAQLRLLRAHPELAGKAMVARSLTAESTQEQSAAGLTACTPEEFARLQQLNTRYNERFGWPFILAVRGPRGRGLSRREIIETFERRLQGHADFEFQECLRNIDRIAELRLNDKFGQRPVLGEQVWDWAEALARHSDAGSAPGELTVTYLTEAHRACARQLCAWMQDAGFDEVAVDAVGNVVGRYLGEQPGLPALMTGSHYDTVRNAGRYDGRLGVLVPIAAVQHLARTGRRLPCTLEVIGFAEEEGQRFAATFLGSSAVVGNFDMGWLSQVDAAGVTMREALATAGLDPAAIPALARRREDYRGFVELHIEQGPVLDGLDLPLGVVSSINASVRLRGEVVGVASHAGTTPMHLRRDAAAAVAELSVWMEARAAADGDSVATIGMLQVPNGSVNVVPGRCSFSLDLRAPSDAQRDRLDEDVRAQLARICERRGLQYSLQQTMRVAAAPCDAALSARWAAAVERLGLPVHRLPSGAGHDAMKLHELLPQAMLFVRGGNAGISHNPLESITSDDADLCVRAFLDLLDSLSGDPS
ncbi:2-oxo-4-hydroxy-4-carboxy-5-ureidoimidazoline decarboxylase [Eleftheria terrae]|uniref:2-oxo-4-hydroxy-4-carboxy-5-ureidoimidazoline decarboxylase n=1 Tax=Eleftheria terrae TaxID=1597781 RepID=UPI00263A8EBA|nr:2-oxo-4-hydroxy-4-carboxy-5-ureidoimidazoline decarboxylase [Eleftheria terrae]WKB55029.1 2-oxo-4-hydroxy-4-carboxy-5-ureidoimidazoline decarboxylase [Eleftheria terrae]